MKNSYLNNFLSGESSVDTVYEYDEVRVPASIQSFDFNCGFTWIESSKAKATVGGKRN